MERVASTTTVGCGIEPRGRPPSLLGILLVLAMLQSFVQGEIRCFCNEASCASRGYTCRSAARRCFSQLSYGGPQQGSSSTVAPKAASLPTGYRHGCLEMLPELDRLACSREPGDLMIRTRGEAGKKGDFPVLMCCHENMCNYLSTADRDVGVDLMEESNGTRTAELAADSGFDQDTFVEVHHAPLLQRNQWFKAAVIGVPIAGGVILTLLVLLAVRMLRNDSRRLHCKQQFQIGSDYSNNNNNNNYSLKMLKAHLYLQAEQHLLVGLDGKKKLVKQIEIEPLATSANQITASSQMRPRDDDDVESGLAAQRRSASESLIADNSDVVVVSEGSKPNR